MSEDMIIKHCAPTLADIKTGSLFSCRYESRESLIKEMRRLNSVFVPKGLRAIPLKIEEKALIYVYRPTRLAVDLSDDERRDILREVGYKSVKTEQCLNELIKRLNASEDFPHEIGLFLSYPPEDVRGFIENRGGNFKHVGCWKVYGNAAAAQNTFERYKRCTESYRRSWENGASMDQLTIRS